jgi:hypothetical protein
MPSERPRGEWRRSPFTNGARNEKPRSKWVATVHDGNYLSPRFLRDAPDALGQRVGVGLNASTDVNRRQPCVEPPSSQRGEVWRHRLRVKIRDEPWDQNEHAVAAGAGCLKSPTGERIKRAQLVADVMGGAEEIQGVEPLLRHVPGRVEKDDRPNPSASPAFANDSRAQTRFQGYEAPQSHAGSVQGDIHSGHTGGVSRTCGRSKVMVVR